MQHQEVSCAVRPIQWPLGVKWLNGLCGFDHLSSVCQWPTLVLCVSRAPLGTVPMLRTKLTSSSVFSLRHRIQIINEIRQVTSPTIHWVLFRGRYGGRGVTLTSHFRLVPTSKNGCRRSSTPSFRVGCNAYTLDFTVVLLS